MKRLLHIVRLNTSLRGALPLTSLRGAQRRGNLATSMAYGDCHVDILSPRNDVRICGLLFILLITVACSKGPQNENGDEQLSFSISTRALISTDGLSGSALPGIKLSENSNWGLYAFSADIPDPDNPILENIMMTQPDGDDDDTEPDYYQEYKPSEGETATAFKGGLIVSAYYPYHGTYVARDNIKYYNPALPDSEDNHDDINPVLTTNSLGHPAIHYGVPDFYRARKPWFSGATEQDLKIDDNIREVILHTSYQTYSVSELQNQKIQVNIRPITCLIGFKFSIAPRFYTNGNPLPLADQPSREDYEIVSVRRHRKGESKVGKGHPDYVDHSTFNYDLLTGEITDRRFKSNGLYYEFPANPADPELNPYGLTGIHPYAVHINSENKVYVDKNEEMILSFVSFPEIYDNLGDIEMEITYRYKLIGKESPEVDDDIWVTSSAVINATSTYIQEGWKSGKVYYYHVYISRHEVRCDVEIIPWVEDDLDNDLFYGEIQV